jgi:hypothetical protein
MSKFHSLYIFQHTTIEKLLPLNQYVFTGPKTMYILR